MLLVSVGFTLVECHCFFFVRYSLALFKTEAIRTFLTCVVLNSLVYFEQILGYYLAYVAHLSVLLISIDLIFNSSVLNIHEFQSKMVFLSRGSFPDDSEPKKF